jgi:hypothetical protein
MLLHRQAKLHVSVDQIKGLRLSEKWLFLSHEDTTRLDSISRALRDSAVLRFVAKDEVHTEKGKGEGKKESKA